ncbi:phage portal protein [Sphingomonas koreensis]|uniref:Phage portal protein n=1 Tax=Sphingomonas koreensis TaxID=93064 RepID=A0A1L6JBV2_9SPHN|nr:phage portal protein [Sphingomonas koreensis]APR53356.1 phage portal protein [Sphingomonas koreensis]RSU24523.1 phage portal protein [Sphingomonas koreensis]RSU25168.1 phage portal protein [Sphingomonas koreensis]RSU30157.1 phage portal protein [Sphingomonas koreensis]RSU37406.1 phage portal protein [Sphingomonas koreensis]
MTVSAYKLSARAAEAEARRSAPIAGLGHNGGPVLNATDSVPVIAGDADMMEWFGSGQRVAGVNVTPETAMRSSAVWRCTTLISGTMMSAPLGVYERLPGNGRRYLEDHEFNRFLQIEPNEEMSGPELIELAGMAILLRGNGYGLIRQSRNGRMTSIDHYHPTRVMPFRSFDRSVWYRFTNEDGTTEDHHSSYVIHFRGPGRDATGLKALAPISQHAQAIGINLASREYTSGQFERGLLTNDYFQFPAGHTITKDQRKAFKDYLQRRAQGVANAHNPLLLENGGEWKRVSVSAKDAQLLELLQYSVVDVARIFGTPPHMIGETSAATSWGTGIEQMTMGFRLYTVMPHLRRFAKELSRKLFPVIGAKMPKLFVDFDPDALDVGDLKSQGDYFARALGGAQGPGWMSQDEVRRKKNLEPMNTPESSRVFYPTAPTAGAAPAADERDEDEDAGDTPPAAAAREDDDDA